MIIWRVGRCAITQKKEWGLDHGNLLSKNITLATKWLCGIRLGVWPLFGVNHIIFLDEFPSQIC